MQTFAVNKTKVQAATCNVSKVIYLLNNEGITPTVKVTGVNKCKITFTVEDISILPEENEYEVGFIPEARGLKS
jgi:hypothetical protein